MAAAAGGFRSNLVERGTNTIGPYGIQFEAVAPAWPGAGELARGVVETISRCPQPPPQFNDIIPVPSTTFSRVRGASSGRKFCGIPDREYTRRWRLAGRVLHCHITTHKMRETNLRSWLERQLRSDEDWQAFSYRYWFRS